MCNESVLAAGPWADLVNMEVLCCPIDWWDTTAVTTAVAIPGECPFLWPVDLLDDAALVFAVQLYLRYTIGRLPVTKGLDRVWDWFVATYWRVAEEEVHKSCRCRVSAADLDDLVQETWMEFLDELPRFVYDPGRSDLCSWLKGLARQTAGRRSGSLLRSRSKRSVATEALEGSLSSSGPGPEDVCIMRELQKQLGDALAELRRRTSQKTYEVFRRRFLEQQNAKEVGLALNLKPEAVRARCCRGMRKLRSLARGLGLSALCRDVASPADFPATEE
jgi:RNA polymerase sigma factor (sigma-70 family)